VFQGLAAFGRHSLLKNKNGVILSGFHGYNSFQPLDFGSDTYLNEIITNCPKAKVIVTSSIFSREYDNLSYILHFIAIYMHK